MNTKAKWKAFAFGTITAILMAGCVSQQTVSGKVVDKYVEDFIEYTVVVEATDGTKHHFEIDEDDWRKVTIGQQFTNTQQAGED